MSLVDRLLELATSIGTDVKGIYARISNVDNTADTDKRVAYAAAAGSLEESALATELPLAGGVPTAGTSTLAARQDHVHDIQSFAIHNTIPSSPVADTMYAVRTSEGIAMFASDQTGNLDKLPIASEGSVQETSDSVRKLRMQIMLDMI